jgi:hypothetical protein
MKRENWILHQVGEKPIRFEFGVDMLQYVALNKVTGYCVDPDHKVINIKKGKIK